MKTARFLPVFLVLGFTSCIVSKQKYTDLQNSITPTQNANRSLRMRMAKLEVTNDSLMKWNSQLNKRNDSLADRNTDLDSAWRRWVRTDLAVKKENATPAAEPKPLSKEWADPKYKAANTAANANYLSKEEKETIRLINLCRMNPMLYLKTYLKDVYEKKPAQRDEYEASLVEEFSKQKSLPPLKPDQVQFKSAKCHAIISGQRGYVGHARKDYPEGSICNFRGECCSYGLSTAENIVKQLIVDDGVPSLGHRHILMGGYTKIGVSLQPHNGYSWNCVLDLV